VESAALVGQFGDRNVSQNDPTDHALATIASILDQPETPPEVEKPVAGFKPVAPAVATTDAEGYWKLGPGPIAAIRFKWTARRADNGEYFVDETIGESSVPVTTGPMTKEAAIALVDERELEARKRFDELRREMSGRAAGPDLVRAGET
jgi:hypothetical protein